MRTFRYRGTYAKTALSETTLSGEPPKPSVLKRHVPKTLAFAFGLRLHSKMRCLKTRVLGRRLPTLLTFSSLDLWVFLSQRSQCFEHSLAKCAESTAIGRKREENPEILTNLMRKRLTR